MSKQLSQLGIIEPLIRSLTDSKISIPTDIQQKSIPLFLKEKNDLVGLAKTGTGKTAAFGLPLLQLIDQEQPHIQGLILAPTRELGHTIIWFLLPNIFRRSQLPPFAEVFQLNLK